MVSDEKRTFAAFTSKSTTYLHSSRAVEVLKKERELLFGIGSNEAIICKSSQLYRLGNDMDVFGVPFGHGVRVSHRNRMRCIVYFG